LATAQGLQRAALCSRGTTHLLAAPPAAAQGLHGLQGLQAAAQGLQGLQAAAQGLQGLHFAAAQGLQGLQAPAAQGLQGLHLAAAQGLHFAAAQGLQGLQAPAAQGLHGLHLATAQGLQGLQAANAGLGPSCPDVVTSATANDQRHHGGRHQKLLIALHQKSSRELGHHRSHGPCVLSAERLGLNSATG
jgi:hypothetical protein